MFNLGDIVVYPCQGIGVVEQIEEREFKGQTQVYYKIHIIDNSMQLSLPMSRVEAAHIRLVSSNEIIESELEHVKEWLKNTKEEEGILPVKERMVITNNKLKTGELREHLIIVCKLSEVEVKSNLNVNEKQILKNTKKMVIEEISRGKEISKEEAGILLSDVISVAI